LGEGLADAEIREWHVKLGDRVVVDQPMVSVETAKAVVEVPVPFSGTVTALHAAVGDIVATGAPLIDFDAGTVVGTMPAPAEDGLFEPLTAEASSRAAVSAVGTVPVAGAVSATSPHARVPIARAAEGHARAVPVARALATRLGLDLSAIAGSGPGGAVSLDDVVRHANLAQTEPRPSALNVAPPNAAALNVAPPNAAALNAAALNGTALEVAALDDAALGDPPPRAEPLRGARRTMAHSMSASRDQVAASTVCDDADIDAWSLRSDTMPRLVRAMSFACMSEPALNAWYDAAANSRTLLKHIDLAIAVDTPSGLIVPVLRNVQDRTLDELRADIAAHKHAAHERRTTAEALRNFTLLLSNFGTLAGRYATPLVVPPAVAILGAGRVRREAVVVADAVVARRRLPLSLSFDHRCVTGGEACRFLAAVITDLEKPD
jgi:pyruvate dehydrogenase E2 component (dihydrolipoamide acetyltransferase)